MNSLLRIAPAVFLAVTAPRVRAQGPLPDALGQARETLHARSGTVLRLPGRVVVLFLGVLFLIPLPSAGAQATPLTPSQTISFSTTNAIGPNALIQGKDGLFYGTTAFGGSASVQACTDTSGNAANCCTDPSGTVAACGTVFSFDPATSKITVLYSFTGGADGGSPTGLVQGGDGYLYGTTLTGGASAAQTACASTDSQGMPIQVPCCLDPSATINVGCGTVFRISTSGQSFQTLNSFYTADANGNFANSGAFPGPLVPGANIPGANVAPGSTASNLFGTTLACSVCDSATGILFSLASPASGSAQVGLVYDFHTGSTGTSTGTKGSSLIYPNALIQGSDGNLYGTTQLAQDNNCMNPGTGSTYGCGGVFVFDLSANATNPEQEKLFSGGTTSVASLSQSRGALQARPNAIVRQPQHGFPSGGNWSFTSDPIMLSEGSDGNIYGTTPPECLPTATPGDYTLSTSCGAQYAANAAVNSPPTVIYNPGTLFQLVPPASGASLSAPNVIYSFNAKPPAAQPADGGGSLSGVTLASDGQLYGSSGNSIFGVPASGSAISTLPIYANLSATSSALVQGSDGNFYGVTAGSSTSSDPGELFVVAGPSSGSSPVQLSFSPNSVQAGSPTTLTWSVNNAFSLSAQQCYAFAQSGAPGASSWTGLQQGATTSQGWGGSLSITPTTTGPYTYAVTCGGDESATATLTVTAGSVRIQTPSFPTGVVGSPYSPVQLQATGGVGPYTWSGAGLPSGMTISSSGLISGTPTTSGTFSLTVQVSDSESTPATANFSIVVVDPLSLQAATLPQGTVGSTYSTTPTKGGGLAPFTWALASGSSLPSGLQLNASTGEISGTPTASGSFNFTIQVTDAESTPATATASFSIDVQPAPTSTVTADPMTVTIASPGGSGSTTLTFANFTSPPNAMTCTGLPAEASCSSSNATATSATLTITTRAPSTSALVWPAEVRLVWGWLLPGLGLFLAGAKRRRRLVHLGVVLLVVAGSVIGCGGGSVTNTHHDAGTPIGSSTVTVTATSGSQVATTTVTLKVGNVP